MKYDNNLQTLTAAQTALEKGDVKQAEHRFKELLNSEPHNSRALDGMGMLHCQLGDSKKAINFFLEALKNCTQPDPYTLTDINNDLTDLDKAAILLHLGIALRTIGKNNDAIETLQHAYSILPNSPEIILNLGQLHFELEQFDEAIGCFRLLTELQPINPSAWLTLGYILYTSGFFKNQINEICTNESPEQNNQPKHKSDFDKNKFNETLAAFKTAQQLDPASPEACFYIAETLRTAEMFQESLPYYQRLLQIGSELPKAVENYGKALLATKDFEYGWDAMEFRFAAEFGTWTTHSLPQWTWQKEINNNQNQNQNEKTKSILAYAEDSIASEIMFASCLPDLINEVDHCVIECETSLHKLFRRSFPRATIVGNTHAEISKTININTPNNHVAEYEQDTQKNIRNNNVWGVDIDEQVAFGSLPRYFRRNSDDFPLRKSYLVPDNDKVSDWINKLAVLGNMPKIGVLWRGCWSSESARQCTLPISVLRDTILQHQSNAVWVSLQNESGQKDFEVYSRNVSIRLHRFNEIFQYDLDTMAALLTALDLVITPPGYIAHLAGALGVKTWLLLPSGSDWRWQLDKSKASLWHPSIKIYHKEIEQSWNELFELVDVELDHFLGSLRTQSNYANDKQQIAQNEPTIIKFPPDTNSRQTVTHKNCTTFKLKKAS
ncbi:MAG: tetratricopeptide repeat protein [Planctomycetaceae bacterium]|jgi:tetratricopeptide (TPR) repeat protein|nr:tetratricopeptide repeat protein [Planctomycetaceae bacterium]